MNRGNREFQYVQKKVRITERTKEMSETIIKTRDLTKCFKDCKALNEINLTVSRGDIYGLIGDNGAGKTTFLKLLAGHLFPTEGEINLFGVHMERELERQRKRTGVIIEQPGFYPQLSVEQNLEYYRIQKGIPGKEIVEDILKIIGLTNMRKKKGKTLSMGMKQRLGLGIALLGEPELLILDEPINGLDPSGIIEMRNLLLRLNREKNITIIISSHILSELEQLATVYGFLDRGCLLEQISAETLHENCKNYLEMHVSDVEIYTTFLEKELHHEAYQILPDETIRIFYPTQDTEIYSRLAGAHGVGITRMELREQTLEEHYMKLKGGERS